MHGKRPMRGPREHLRDFKRLRYFEKPTSVEGVYILQSTLSGKWS